MGSVAEYYDEHAAGKIRDFVFGNPRVDRAWQAVVSAVDCTPSRALEVGCGIGAICSRMNREWPRAEIHGIDLSPRSIAIAERLFGSEEVFFRHSSYSPGSMQGEFDLIVMMDVYEHIPVRERPMVHEALKRDLSQSGILVMSFPTPRHQRWLRVNSPDGIQPVDEDITACEIMQLAEDIDGYVLSYSEISVWHPADYAHAVIGRFAPWDTPSGAHDMSRQHTTLPRRVVSTARRRLGGLSRGSREQRRRARLVTAKLGPLFLGKQHEH